MKVTAFHIVIVAFLVVVIIQNTITLPKFSGGGLGLKSLTDLAGQAPIIGDGTGGK